MTKQSYKKSISKMVEVIMQADGISPDEHPNLWIDLSSAFHRFVTEIDSGETPAQARLRVAADVIDKTGVIIQLQRNGADREQYRRRVETAVNLSPNWDDLKEDWNGFELWLMEKEEGGQTIEQFMTWYNSDEFRAKGGLWLNPPKIKKFWPQAFGHKTDETRPEYKPFPLAGE